MKLLLVVAASLLGFVACELLVRVATGTMGVWEDPDVVEPTIGQMMRPGMSMHNPFTGFRVTNGDHSTRENGNPNPPAEQPVTLAVVEENIAARGVLAHQVVVVARRELERGDDGMLERRGGADGQEVVDLPGVRDDRRMRVDVAEPPSLPA